MCCEQLRELLKRLKVPGTGLKDLTPMSAGQPDFDNGPGDRFDGAGNDFDSDSDEPMDED